MAVGWPQTSKTSLHAPDTRLCRIPHPCSSAAGEKDILPRATWIKISWIHRHEIKIIKVPNQSLGFQNGQLNACPKVAQQELQVFQAQRWNHLSPSAAMMRHWPPFKNLAISQVCIGVNGQWFGVAVNSMNKTATDYCLGKTWKKWLLPDSCHFWADSEHDRHLQSASVPFNEVGLSLRSAMVSHGQPWSTYRLAVIA